MTRRNCEPREIKNSSMKNKNKKKTQSCVFASACNESMIKEIFESYKNELQKRMCYFNGRNARD